jgi:hypothetical protein
MQKQSPSQKDVFGNLFLGLVMKKIFLLLVSFSLMLVSSLHAFVEGPVVRNKYYPLEKRFSLSIAGGILFNQSYIDTKHLSGSLGFNFSDAHAVKIEGSFFQSKDRSERLCVESFFADPEASAQEGVGAPCDPQMQYESTDALTKRPAYVPIRQLNQALTINYQYTPVYGKAIWLRSVLSYLDLFLNVGLGVTSNTYWPLRTKTASGQDILKDGAASNAEAGEAGRPDPHDLYSPLLSLGFGNRFYLLHFFSLSVELKNFSIIGLDEHSGFDPILTGLWLGLSFLL